MMPPRWPSMALASWPLLVLLATTTVATSYTPGEPVGSVTVVTVASDARDASALLASAPLAGIDIVLLGEGIAMPWPNGLRMKIIMVQQFVKDSQLDDDDLIVFVDAWDTMVLADSAESLKAGFIQTEKATGRPIIFAPEEFCWPQDKESKDTMCAYFDSVAPPQFKRRYLNSGLYAGRHKHFKELFAAPIPEKLPLSDQPWFQQQFRATELIGLDYTQILFAAHPFSQMTWRTSPETGRWGMQDMTTGSRPSVVHWNGPAHWCKTAAGGFGHNFVSDYQRAALRVVGFMATPLHCDALQVVEIVSHNADACRPPAQLLSLAAACRLQRCHVSFVQVCLPELPIVRVVYSGGLLAVCAVCDLQNSGCNRTRAARRRREHVRAVATRSIAATGSVQRRRGCNLHDMPPHCAALLRGIPRSKRFRSARPRRQVCVWDQHDILDDMSWCVKNARLGTQFICPLRWLNARA